MPEPRAAKIRRAIAALDVLDIQPSPGRIQKYLGDTVTHRLNGRDSKVYAEEMERLGYKRTRIYSAKLRHSYGVNRWRKE